MESVRTWIAETYEFSLIPQIVSANLHMFGPDVKAKVFSWLGISIGYIEPRVTSVMVEMARQLIKEGFYQRELERLEDEEALEVIQKFLEYNDGL